MPRRDRILLEKISAEIDIALKMLSGVEYEKFAADEILKRAVCMTVINIGELVKNLSDEVRMKYPEIPWRSISGFRDIAAHKYQTLRMEDVYQTVNSDFPALRKEIALILAKGEIHG